MSIAPTYCRCGHLVRSFSDCPCGQRAKAERRAKADQARPSASKRGYDSKWQKARAAFLRDHPRCFLCGEPATVVHHVIPHKGDMNLFWKRSNWSPRCDPCHNRLEQSKEKRAQ